MTSGQRRDDAGESVAEAQAPDTPWWSARRIRLPVLIVCLGIAVFALLGGRRGILLPGSGSSAASTSWCVPVIPPPLRQVSLRQLGSLRASLVPVMEPLARSRYAWGVVPAEVVWTDNPPRRIGASEIDGGWPGAFEMLSWTTDPQLAPQLDDIGAAVFLFASSAQASRFFAQATGTRCHRDGTERAAARPPQARNLIWVNPDGPTQEDVFLLRGPRVYRIADVRPENRSHRSSNAAQQAGVARVNALACTLPDANCPRSGA